MRPNLLIAALLVVAPVWLGAQSGRAPTAPEAFSGTAQAKNAVAAVSGVFEMRIDRYTPEFDRKTVEEALRVGGYPRFVPALRNAPIVGQLVLAGGQPYPIRYAREIAKDGGREITIVTEKPVLFLGSSRADPKSRVGFEVAVVQVQVDANGRGKGVMAAAARVRPDGNGGVLLDDYADELIDLTNVTRKAQ